MLNMPRIHLIPDSKTLIADPTETILQVSLRCGIPHTHVCGGKARCSTCRVLVVEGLQHCSPRNAKEQQMADLLHFTADIRLACQTTVTGDAEMRRLVLDADDIDLVDQLRSPTVPVRVGEERQVAILFADIRRFTAFAEQLPPYDVIHALNRYFYRMEQIIRNHHGYIDNYMGDGLMALFGTTEPETAPLDAVRAGLEMLKAVKGLDPYYASIYGQRLEIGIGVHYGTVVLGSIGSPGGNRVTAIGDAVNFASRIETANKVTRTGFLISDETYRCVMTHVEVKKLEDIALPGRMRPCTLYEPIAIKP